MNYKAIVSGHIWIEDGKKDIEILTHINNDDEGTDIFCDIEHAILEQLDTGDCEDYYFIAIVKSEFVEHKHWEGSEWDVENEVIEINKVGDVSDAIN